MKTLTFLLTCALIISACSDDESSLPEVPTPDYASLEITVTYCNRQLDPKCENTEGLPNTVIKIYKTEIDRINEENLVTSGTTNSEGKLNFYTLEGRLYYFFVSSPHGEQLIEEQTVARGKTTLFVDY